MWRIVEGGLETRLDERLRLLRLRLPPPAEIAISGSCCQRSPSRARSVSCGRGGHLLWGRDVGAARRAPSCPVSGGDPRVFIRAHGCVRRATATVRAQSNSDGACVRSAPVAAVAKVLVDVLLQAVDDQVVGPALDARFDRILVRNFQLISQILPTWKG